MQWVTIDMHPIALQQDVLSVAAGQYSYLQQGSNERRRRLEVSPQSLPQC